MRRYFAWMGTSIAAFFAGLIGMAVVAAIIVLAILAGAQLSIFSANVNAHVAKATVNAKTTQRIYDPTNRISKQEYFHTVYNDFLKYLAEIKQAKLFYKQYPSQMNQANLQGVVYQCINTATDYNAEAKKITAAIWRDSDLPSSLDYNRCHA